MLGFFVDDSREKLSFLEKRSSLCSGIDFRRLEHFHPRSRGHDQNEEEGGEEEEHENFGRFANGVDELGKSKKHTTYQA